MSRAIDQAFAPIAGAKVRVLILGSMPSQRSLKKQQYYAHPQNAFWKIMSRLFSMPDGTSYEHRAERLMQSGIAIWDVIERCHRPGSMDSDIAQDTVVVNDFESFFAQHPELECVLFNGQAAAKTFQKHLGKDFLTGFQLQCNILPSTSPAYAAMRLDEKYQKWRQAMEFLL